MTPEVTPAMAIEMSAQVMRGIAKAGPAGAPRDAWSIQMPAAAGAAATMPITSVRSGGLGTNTARPTWVWVRMSSTRQSSPAISPGHRMSGREAAAVDTIGKAPSRRPSIPRARRPRRHTSHMSR
jgi:hypothetical protein